MAAFVFRCVLLLLGYLSMLKQVLNCVSGCTGSFNFLLCFVASKAFEHALEHVQTGAQMRLRQSWEPLFFIVFCGIQGIEHALEHAQAGALLNSLFRIF